MSKVISNVLIVGGGHGGAQAAIALRQNGFDGAITIVGRETEPPYERPPLSKEYLAGEKQFERLHIRPRPFWADKGVELSLGRSVVAVNSHAHTATLDDGSTRPFGAMIWAAGGDPRRLSCPGNELAGVHGVRNRADVDKIIAELPAVEQIVVIGGGYIGLEAAAVFIKLGKKVVLLEALPRILARVAGEDLSTFYTQEHEAHGVDMRTGVTVAALDGINGKVTAVSLGDGSKVPAQMVIVGIGIIPMVEPLLAAGALGGNGVDVDQFCRTSLPDIYAIGDCAAHSSDFADGAVVRVESVQNANDQAITAAKAICGDLRPYRATPWFWSNQFDLRLQTVGLSTGFDQAILRREGASRAFSVVYLKRGRVIALDCVNMTKDYVQGRKLVEGAAVIDAELLSDVSTPLKDLMPTLADEYIQE